MSHPAKSLRAASRLRAAHEQQCRRSETNEEQYHNDSNGRVEEHIGVDLESVENWRFGGFVSGGGGFIIIVVVLAWSLQVWNTWCSHGTEQCAVHRSPRRPRRRWLETTIQRRRHWRHSAEKLTPGKADGILMQTQRLWSYWSLWRMDPILCGLAKPFLKTTLPSLVLAALTVIIQSSTCTPRATSGINETMEWKVTPHRAATPRPAPVAKPTTKTLIHASEKRPRTISGKGRDPQHLRVFPTRGNRPTRFSAMMNRGISRLHCG